VKNFIRKYLIIVKDFIDSIVVIIITTAIARVITKG